MSTPETEDNVNSTFSNDHVSVIVTKKPHCQVKFDIRVQPSGVMAAYQKARKNINKEVSIPGFRKGRAPENLIQEKFSSAIEKECVDLVLETGFNEGLQLTSIHPLKDGRIKRPVVRECSQEKGAHFIVEFESRPHIPKINLEDLQIKKVNPAPITDQERQNALNNLLLQFTTYDPLVGKAVEENDFVDISMTILEEPPREIVHNQRTQVSNEGLPSWIREKVIGLQAGESVEGMTEQDASSSNSNQFVSIPFRATIHAIWKGTTPQVDEELAKRVGLTSVEELFNKINERLEQQNEEEAFRAKIQALNNLLTQKYPIDLPQSYIDSNKKNHLENYLKELKNDKIQYTHEDMVKIEQMVEENTIHHLQLYLILRKIAADYNITTNQEDMSQELTRQVTLMQMSKNEVDFSGDKDKLHEQLLDLALDRKIKQFLIDHIETKD